MSRDAVFSASLEGDREAIRLVRRERGGLLRKHTSDPVPTLGWILDAPEAARTAVAMIMQAHGDGETGPDGTPLVELRDEEAALHPAFAAGLSESEATSIGLPPVSRLSLSLQSFGLLQNEDFRVVTRWTRPGGVNANAIVEGARIRHDGKDWRIPEPVWSILELAQKIDAARDAAERQSSLAALRRKLGDDERDLVHPDGFIERLRISYAAGFSLDLKASKEGFQFDPVLFSPERMIETDDGAVLDEAADSLLPPVQQAAFAKRFRQGDGTRRAYLLDGGSILFLDPALHRALKVVRRAQAGSAEDRKAFACDPRRLVAQALAASGLDPAQASALFVETQQFSDRVSGIDVWRQPVLPWIKPKPNSWLPEEFGLRVGSPPNHQDLTLRPEEVGPALTAIERAIHEGRSTVNVAGMEIPATEQARQAVADLASLAEEARKTGGEGPPPKVAAERYFLQVRENLDELEYAPLASPPAAPAADAEFPRAASSIPKPHQVVGFRWLASCWTARMPGAMLADDMGLGKTFQALAFLAWLRSQQKQPKPALIVAPTGLLANWQAEIEQHLAPGTLGAVVRAYGSGLSLERSELGRDIELGRSTLDGERWSHAGVVLTTFETMRDYHLSFARHPFAAIIYDEAQKLKNPASQTTRAAKTLNARFQLAMTGTPVENRLQDLWSIFDVVQPGFLGTSRAFEQTFPSSDLDKVRKLHETLIEPSGGRPQVLLRRMKDDCLPGLPSKHIHALEVEMPPPQARAYERVLQRAMIAKGSREPGYMLEILHNLRGVSLHPAKPEEAGGTYFEDSARLTSTFSILDTIKAKGEKALIFCESIAMQAVLAAELRRRYGLDHDVQRIHGGITGDARKTSVDTFQRGGQGFDVMILSPKAGGVGLTLTAANHVIHLSRWWNPAVEDQATDRVFRIGQSRDVHVYLPQAVHPDPALRPHSFDLKLDELMRRKREVSRGLLLPGDDPSDTSTLFDEILSEKAEPREVASASGTSAPPHPSSPNRPEPRPTLTPRQTIAARKPTAYRRTFEVNAPRDFAIFVDPLNGSHVLELIIRDTYACARPRNRQMLVDFVKQLAAGAERIDLVVVHSLDGCSVGGGESDHEQADDLRRRWRAAFASAPQLRHVQVSKRAQRAFHAREIRAKTAGQHEFLWDLDNGVDGVMRPDARCVVGFWPL